MLKRLPYIVFILDLLLSVMVVAPELTQIMGPHVSWSNSIIGLVFIVLLIIFIGLLIHISVVMPIVAIALFVGFIFSLATKRLIRGENELTMDKRKASLRHVLRLFLTAEEEENIVGDLLEESAEIAAKHGEWYAKLWYYKQVAASVWPMVRKAVSLGLLAWAGDWIRRLI